MTFESLDWTVVGVYFALLLELRPDGLPLPLAWLAGVNFLYFGFALFVACVVLLCAVSAATAPPSESALAGLTFGSRPSGAARTWTTMDLVHSVVIVGLVVSIMVYFTG